MAQDPQAAKTGKKVQTPGDDPQAGAEDPVLNQGDEPEATSDDQVQDPQDEGTEQDRYMEVIKQQQLEIQRLQGLLKAAGVPFETAQQVKESKLPDSKDVDPKKIKSAVLTKQGWVLPAN